MTIFIMSKSGDDAKKIQETLTKVLNPTKVRIKVKGMRPAGKTQIVETNTETDAEKIINNKEIGKSLKCEPLKKE